MDASVQSEAFYAGALPRIRVVMMVLGGAGTLAFLVFLGWRPALGLLCGCAVSYLNFLWLERVVTALADRVVEQGTQQSSSGVVLRFLLRYAFMALAAYAILTVSPASLYGLLVGLFLPVGAIACEAVYEVYTALLRGM
jgi:hypothetical protein